MKDMTLGQIGRAIVRYRPFVATIAGLVLIATVLPGRSGQTGELDASGLPQGYGPSNRPTASRGADWATPTSAGEATIPRGEAQLATGAAGGSETPSAPTPEGEVAQSGPPVANCDTAAGTLMIPTIYAPACMPVYSGDNGGATYRGVSAEEIVVAIYDPQDNPVVTSVLEAAGADDSEEQQKATTEAYFRMFESLFETYGRTVKTVWVNGSGPSADDAAARADAVHVAEEIGAFASLGAPNSTAYVDELVARGVVCICTNSLPIEFYMERDPYVMSPGLPASTQAFVHRAELLGKKLADRKAVHAGDPLLQQLDRAFGLIYYETADEAYKAGVDFFEKELTKYGVALTARVEYAPGDPSQSQEQARTVIARMKDKGVTSVLCECDPISPIFFTNQATRQNYSPEWIIIGSGLTDSAFFARTYDQNQWAHAFGVSHLPVRVPQVEADPYELHEWFYGVPPEADDSYLVIFPGPSTFMRAVHGAGPNLNPTTLRDGLFRIPPAGGAFRGGVSAAVSYGTDKGIWPWPDYVGIDDATEIWWDRSVVGPDELGNEGAGLYRYVDGGRRYLPGQWTADDVKAFQPEGTMTIYETTPDSDRPPDYPCTTKTGEPCPSG